MNPLNWNVLYYHNDKRVILKNRNNININIKIHFVLVFEFPILMISGVSFHRSMPILLFKKDCELKNIEFKFRVNDNSTLHVV